MSPRTPIPINFGSTQAMAGSSTRASAPYVPSMFVGCGRLGWASRPLSSITTDDSNRMRQFPDNPDNPYTGANQLLRAVKPLKFEDILPRAGTNTDRTLISHAAVFDDLDNRGDVDIVVANVGHRARVLRNIAEPSGS